MTDRSSQSVSFRAGDLCVGVDVAKDKLDPPRSDTGAFRSNAPAFTTARKLQKASSKSAPRAKSE